MPEDAENARLRRWRRLAIGTWAAMAALAAVSFMAMFVMAATDPTENIALSRNDVVSAPSGERTWRGTFWNHSDSLYTNLDAVILFLDKDGNPVGQARGGAERLEPGETFNLQATLPADAVNMRIYQLRWTSDGGHRAVLGPYRPWPFGYVMDTECGELRLKIGSCVPQRERS
ncbi:FxLYD domain-containing protein [Bradyrhizobium sp. LHD-71]|uniref:FxLYD domain-containing protein n=1 Tax=Bradyrhizobium sp. LHD-71 TaxID=3072141 RepID=UPI00280EF921|nr:FxLYD domain-containing protein [Bradyrhizobium sp. LHD-71]MDQ8729519.1 FxLYD domain-containing protein [Bradyrhizobium sp. LHD-71]